MDCPTSIESSKLEGIENAFFWGISMEEGEWRNGIERDFCLSLVGRIRKELLVQVGHGGEIHLLLSAYV